MAKRRGGGSKPKEEGSQRSLLSFLLSFGLSFVGSGVVMIVAIALVRPEMLTQVRERFQSSAASSVRSEEAGRSVASSERSEEKPPMHKPPMPWQKGAPPPPMPGEPSNFECAHLHLSLAPSLISGAGNGVFVGVKVMLHQPLVFYHGDDQLPANTPDRFAYAMTMKSGETLVGYKPNKTACGLGQLINDRSAIFVDHPTSFSRMMQAVATYEEVSTAGANMEADEDDQRVMFSARQLEAGEELYLKYGPAYWLTLDGMIEANPSAALLGYMVLTSLQDFPNKKQKGAPAVYNQKTRQLEVDGNEVDETQAESFIKFLGLLPTSSLWEQLGVSSASSVVKMKALWEPLSRDEMTLDVRYDKTDPGYVEES